MTYQFADQAAKNITSAIPTVDADGKVKSWKLEITYSLNGYKSTYQDEIKNGELPTLKTPEEYTKAELFDLCNHARWNMVYDSQYDSVMNVPANPDRVLGSFDVTTLA
jgi:hypothetical protein